MTIIRIEGIKYEILQYKTPEQMEADDNPNVARQMREYKALAHLYIKRIKGRRIYFSVEYLWGFTKPLAVA